MNDQLRGNKWKAHLTWIGLLSILAFWPTLKVGFMIDDQFLLGAIQRDSGTFQQKLVSDLTQSVHKQASSVYYRPVLSLLSRAEFELWGINPTGYHLVSLLFHTANALLIFGLFVTLGFPVLASLGAALLFAVNPVIIDDLLAATGGESMANFLLLGTLLLLVRGHFKAGVAVSVLVFFAKESNVILPALTAVCFLYQRRPLKEYWPVLAMLPFIFLFLLFRSGAISTGINFDFQMGLRFGLMAFPRIAAHYFGVLFAPVSLETWPPMMRISPLWPAYLLAMLAIIGVIAWKGSRAIWFCLAAFLITFAPRIPAITHNNVLMDKWIALSSPFIFLALCLGLWRLAEKFQTKNFPWVVIGIFVIFWSTVAHAEVRLRGSDEKNYLWTIRNGPREFANYRLGVIYLNTGRPDKAVEVLRPLIEMLPDQPDYSNALALSLWHSGNRDEAVALIRQLQKKFENHLQISRNAAWMAEQMKAGKK